MVGIAPVIIRLGESIDIDAPELVSADVVLVGCSVVVPFSPEPIIDDIETPWTKVTRRKLSAIVEIMTDSTVCPARPMNYYGESGKPDTSRFTRDNSHRLRAQMNTEILLLWPVYNNGYIGRTEDKATYTWLALNYR